MLSRVARQDVGGDLEVRYWRDGSQLEEQLAAAMRKHLKLTDDKKAYIPFNASLGIAEDLEGQQSAAGRERWQILSPVRNHEFGTTEINRKIQGRSTAGGDAELHAKGKGIKPFGDQEIVWTDKVMQAINCLEDKLPERRGTRLRSQWRNWPRGSDLEGERPARLDEGAVLDTTVVVILLRST